MTYRSHRILFTVMALALFATLVAGCYPPALTPGSAGSTGTATEAPTVPPPGETPQAQLLPSTDWQLTVAGGQPVPGNVDAHLQFGAGNEVGGSTGCNLVSGTYETPEPGKIAFSALITTKRACTMELAGIEQAVLQALDEARGYTLTNGVLTLTAADGMELAQFVQRATSSLTDTGWVATGINNGKGGVVSVTGNVTALFGADGRLGGNAGCNSYGAPYTVAGDKLTIEQPVSTLMACADQAVTDQEQAYLKALPQVATFTISGDVLELRDANGALQVSYRAAKG